MNELKKLLSKHDSNVVNRYIAYCNELKTAKKNGVAANPWMEHNTTQKLAEYFEAVAIDGMYIDGEHITIQSTGISYDYVAFKNKMLKVYPESLVDVGLVHEGDEFSASKDSSMVLYSHKIGDPFNRTEHNIKGGYCIIKNKRGEFITLLSKEDINKHRKVARGDFIWKQWPLEMAMKTLVKKACKQHFQDIYSNIEEVDNENYDLDNPLDIKVDHKSKIDSINDIDDLKEYYLENKGLGKSFDMYVTKRKEQILSLNSIK